MLNKTTLAAAAIAATALFSVTTVQAQTTTVVGAIPAEFDVINGAATYSVPIAVAPGRGGMQPELSFKSYKVTYENNIKTAILILYEEETKETIVTVEVEKLKNPKLALLAQSLFVRNLT